MKQHSVLVTILSILIFSQCSTDDDHRKPSQLELKFVVDIAESGNTATRSRNLPEDVKLLISVQSKSGKLSVTHFELELSNTGDRYVSEPFVVDPGRYVIQDFFVVSSASRLLCATPKDESELAYRVNHPLPYSFTASKGKSDELAMQVIPVNGHSSEDFGYSSFGIDVAQSINVAVYESSEGPRNLTDASLRFEQDSLVILESNLDPVMNNIPFNGDPEAQFLMVITKDGFVPYRRLTSYSQLESSGSTNVEVDLTPLGEYLAFDDQMGGPMVGFNGPSTIDIFDPNDARTYDVAQDYDPDDFYSQTIWLSYDYMETVDRRVFIKGDLEKVNFLMLTNASLLVTTHTPNLGEINISGSFKKLDFSNNSKLWQIAFTGVVAEELIFPADHEIRYVALYYNTSHVPYIIENIYRNAVRKNLTDGSMSLSDLDDNILNSFTPEIDAMLNDLRNNYGWAIYE